MRNVLLVFFLLIACALWTDSSGARQTEKTKNNVFALSGIAVKDATETNKNITIEKIDKDRIWEFNAGQVGTFALINTKASYEIKKNLSIEAGMKNLFDRNS